MIRHPNPLYESGEEVARPVAEPDLGIIEPEWDDSPDRERLRRREAESAERKAAWKQFVGSVTINGVPYSVNEPGYGIAMTAFYSAWSKRPSSSIQIRQPESPKSPHHTMWGIFFAAVCLASFAGFAIGLLIGAVHVH